MRRNAAGELNPVILLRGMRNSYADSPARKRMAANSGLPLAVHNDESHVILLQMA